MKKMKMKMMRMIYVRECLRFYLGGRQMIGFFFLCSLEQKRKGSAARYLWDPQRLGALIPALCPLGPCSRHRHRHPSAGALRRRASRGPRVPSPVGRARGRHPDQLFRNRTRPPRPCPSLKSLSRLRASELPAARPGQAPPAAWPGTPISAGGCRSSACSCRWPWWSSLACSCATTWMPTPTGSRRRCPGTFPATWTTNSTIATRVSPTTLQAHLRHIRAVPTGLRALPGLTSAASCSGTSGRREPEEEMLPTAPCPAPLRLPTRGTSQCLKIKLGKWHDVHKFLSPPESSPGRAHSFQVPPETSNLPVRELFLMSSKDLSLILVTNQWVTLVPLSSCAHALHVKGVLPMSRAAGVAHWPTSPAAGRGVGDHGTYHLLAWRGRKSTPEFSRICGAVVKSMALESPDLTSIMALPLTRWVALGKCHQCRN